MTLSNKLLFLSSTLIMGLLVLGVFSSWGFEHVGRAIRGVVELDIPISKNVSNMEIFQLEQGISLRDAILEASEHGPKAPGFLTEAAHFESLNNEVAEELHEIEEFLKTIKLHDEVNPEIQQFETMLYKVEDVHKLYGEKGSALFSDIQRNPDFEGTDLDRHMEQILPLDHQLAELLERSHKTMQKKLDTTSHALEQMEESMVLAVEIMTIAFLALGSAVAYGIHRSVMRQLGGDPMELAALATRIADGDLQRNSRQGSPQGHSGVLSSMVGMQAKITEVIVDVARISKLVKSGTKELAQGAVGLGERTQQQAANLEETAASSEQIAVTVRGNAKNALSACSLAESTSAQALEGGGTAGAAVTAMEGISKASEEVSAIVGVIDEIAFQTNLLALNAAVEAARAGEQGRGFAVVATEVRQLASRSALAAKEIKELIEQNVHRVQEGSMLVVNSGNELNSIAESIGKLTQIISQITESSEEQSVGVDQINQALIELDSSTQQNAALVEETQATTENLSLLVEQLDQKISYFAVTQAT